MNSKVTYLLGQIFHPHTSVVEREHSPTIPHPAMDSCPEYGSTQPSGRRRLAHWTLQLLFLMVDHNHRKFFKTSDTGIKLRRVTTIDPLTVSMNLWHGITPNDLEMTHLRHERPCTQSPLYNYHCIRRTQAYFKEISPHKKVCNTTLCKKILELN